ncbi:MAG: hypothetical protein AMS15_07465 [Planctomycetes bacterium DG_23]|nr:MAG: hypothetical protein AMS15_07465 [Planctomycetes bacterium DG_23]
MPEARCPGCRQIFSYKKSSDFPHFPFCSERCRMVDLGRWFEEEYCISEKLGDAEDMNSYKRLRVAKKSGGSAGNSPHNTSSDKKD